MIYPFTAGMLAAVLFLILASGRFRRTGIAGLALSLAWLWLWSLPVFGNFLVGWLEQPWSLQPVDDVPAAEAIVILGGGFWGASPSRPYPQVTPGANRYWYGARLFHANKGKTVILSGGTSEIGQKQGRLTEAESGAQFLQDMQVPKQALLLDDEAMTTRENAVNIARMMEVHELSSFILVTSASHMRRSIGAFRAVGLEPIAAAGHFRVDRDRERTWRAWLPSANGARLAGLAFHEIIGYEWYRIRGWVDSNVRDMSQIADQNKNQTSKGEQ